MISQERVLRSCGRMVLRGDVLAALLKMKQPFVMPAKKNKKVVELIKAYHAGTGKGVLRYTIIGKNSQPMVTLIIEESKRVTMSRISTTYSLLMQARMWHGVFGKPIQRIPQAACHLFIKQTIIPLNNQDWFWEYDSDILYTAHTQTDTHYCF